jgi:hypothetical protein
MPFNCTATMTAHRPKFCGKKRKGTGDDNAKTLWQDTTPKTLIGCLNPSRISLGQLLRWADGGKEAEGGWTWKRRISLTRWRFR